MQNSQGFSLTETLVVLAVIAGVLGFAVPGWQNQIIAKEVDVASGRLFRDLQLARAESIRRGVALVLRPSEDPDQDQYRDPNEAILFVGPSTAPVTVGWRRPNWIRFTPEGAAWPNGHFRICGNNLSKARVLLVYWTGRDRFDNKDPSGGLVFR